MHKMQDLANILNKKGYISIDRLLYESKLMMKEFRHVRLEINPRYGPMWKGYVKSQRIKNYFAIIYPKEYPSWRPHLYPLTNERGEFKYDKEKIGLHPFRERGVCLFTHDGGPDSWNDSLTAVDCVKKYIDYLNSKKSGVLDHQDLQDRLTIPGRRKNDIKYIITPRGYEQLKTEKKGMFSASLVRKIPELFLIDKCIANNGQIVSLNQSWFSNFSFWCVSLQ